MLKLIISSIICAILSAYATLRWCRKYYNRRDLKAWKVRWVKVTDRLPKPLKSVLVAFVASGKKKPRIILSRWRKDGKFEIENKYDGKVIAWAVCPPYLIEDETKESNS